MSSDPRGRARLRPMPGMLLIRRDEISERSGLVILPATWTSRRRSMMGTVVESAAIPKLLPGQRVLMSAGVGRKVMLGREALYVCGAGEILAVMTDEPESVDVADESPLRVRPAPDFAENISERRLDTGKVVVRDDGE